MVNRLIDPGRSTPAVRPWPVELALADALA